MSDKKIAVRDIQIHWTENNGTKERTYPSLARVNSSLRYWAITAPVHGQGYHKTKFTLTWEDGGQYSGRIDLEREAHGNIMGNHIRSYLEFLSGRSKPAHMTKEQYGQFTSNKKQVEEAINTLENYDLEEGI